MVTRNISAMENKDLVPISYMNVRNKIVGEIDRAPLIPSHAIRVVFQGLDITTILREPQD